MIENGLPFLINLLAGLFDFLGEHQWIIDAIGAALLGAFVSSKISPLVLGIRSAITSLIGVFTGAGGLSGAISMIVTAFDRFAVASNVIPIAIVKFCKEARGEDLVLLLRAAVLTNEDIAAELFTCLKLGIGYEVIYKKHWIPMQRKDFQGYRRKTLETVERLLLMRDIEMEE